MICFLRNSLGILILGVTLLMPLPTATVTYKERLDILCKHTPPFISTPSQIIDRRAADWRSGIRRGSEAKDPRNTPEWGKSFNYRDLKDSVRRLNAHKSNDDDFLYYIYAIREACLEIDNLFIHIDDCYVQLNVDEGCPSDLPLSDAVNITSLLNAYEALLTGALKLMPTVVEVEDAGSAGQTNTTYNLRSGAGWLLNELLERQSFLSYGIAALYTAPIIEHCLFSVKEIPSWFDREAFIFMKIISIETYKMNGPAFAWATNDDKKNFFDETGLMFYWALRVTMECDRRLGGRSHDRSIYDLPLDTNNTKYFMILDEIIRFQNDYITNVGNIEFDTGIDKQHPK